MRFVRHVLTGFIALFLGGTALASAIDIEGVLVDDSATVGGNKLRRNGAGVFYKEPFKVYVGELHTTKMVQSLAELIAVSGPKRVTMTFVRDMDSVLISKLMTRGIEDNVAKSEFSKLIPGLVRMSEIFSKIKSFGRGDVITLDWIPNTGLIISIKGKTQGEPFKEPEFFNALMATWLGPMPAYWKLKNEMLGIQ